MGYFADQANSYSAAQPATVQQTTTRAERGMPDAIASGIVLGVMLAVIAIVVTLGRKLQANQSEGAKRLKLTIKAGVALFVVLAIMNSGNDAPFLIGIAAIIGVAYWIYKGF